MVCSFFIFKIPSDWRNGRWKMFKEGLLSLLPAGVVGLFLFYLLSRGVDFATGLLKTWKNKNSYKSRIMRDGIIICIAEFIH